MIRKFINGISVVAVLILFMPTIARINHHHDPVACWAKSEKHLQDLHERCPVCSFEFSLFLAERPVIASSKTEFPDNFKIQISDCHFPDSSKFSSFLRAPPINTSAV
jgi:hypothetical protein